MTLSGHRRVRAQTKSPSLSAFEDVVASAAHRPNPLHHQRRLGNALGTPHPWGEMSSRSEKLAQPLPGTSRTRDVDVLARCNACGHVAVLAPGVYLTKLGVAYPVPAVRKAVRCSDGGSRDVETRPHWSTMGGGPRYPD